MGGGGNGWREGEQKQAKEGEQSLSCLPWVSEASLSCEHCHISSVLYPFAPPLCQRVRHHSVSTDRAVQTSHVHSLECLCAERSAAISC